MMSLFRNSQWNQCDLRHPWLVLGFLVRRNLDGKGKAGPSGPPMCLLSLKLSGNWQGFSASRFAKNLNDINARSAIHPQLGQERAGKRRRAPP
jgi:hypothetical protein